MCSGKTEWIQGTGWERKCLENRYQGYELLERRRITEYFLIPVLVCLLTERNVGEERLVVVNPKNTHGRAYIRDILLKTEFNDKQNKVHLYKNDFPRLHENWDDLPVNSIQHRLQSLKTAIIKLVSAGKIKSETNITSSSLADSFLHWPLAFLVDWEETAKDDVATHPGSFRRQTLSQIWPILYFKPYALQYFRELYLNV